MITDGVCTSELANDVSDFMDNGYTSTSKASAAKVSLRSLSSVGVMRHPEEQQTGPSDTGVATSSSTETPVRATSEPPSLETLPFFIEAKSLCC